MGGGGGWLRCFGRREATSVIVIEERLQQAWENYGLGVHTLSFSLVILPFQLEETIFKVSK